MRTHRPRLTSVARLGFLLITLAGCALSHGVRPVGENKVAIDASLGGPVADYMGGKKPLPLTMVGLTYGLSDQTNLHGGIYPSSLAMFGLVGVEVGVSHLVLGPDGARPAIMIDGTVIGLGGNLAEGPPDGGFVPYVQTSMMASWAYGDRGHLIYTGPELLTLGFKAFGINHFEATHPGWTIGHRLNAGRWGVGTELGWMAPQWDNSPAVVEYVGIAGRGAVTVNVGVTVALGGKQ